MSARAVLMNAGPWCPVPPPGYGGIENVIATLVPELRSRGVRVVMATVGESTLPADGMISAFDEPQYPRLTRPLNEGTGVAHVHMQAVVEQMDHHEPDLVHDHLEVVGPSVMALIGQPTLQTLHWDTHRNHEFYETFDGHGNVFFAGVSDRQVQLAPAAVRDQTLGSVPLAVDPEQFPFEPVKEERLNLQLARITPQKGQHVTVHLGCDAVLAGPIQDEAYWHGAVEPWVDGEHVRFVGPIGGDAKLEALSHARAALFPVQWEEPGATAAIEALACGTPVVAMRRGCLPSIVEHGVTGFIADTEEEFADYVARAGEIDPAACRRSVEDRFSVGAMGDRYLELYDEVMRRTPPGPPRAVARQRLV